MPGFVDEAQVHVKAGNGGAGAVSFRREAYVSKGGPDGGDGGPGGNVFLEASNQVVSLLGFEEHPFRRAADGTHGSGKRRHGRRGSDLVVPVPEGTLVHSLDGDLLADLVTTGDRFLAAEGGRGRARQHEIPHESLAGPCLRRAGRAGGGALARPRARAHGGRRPRRVPERRQIDARLTGVCRSPEDRRLPLHDARSPPRRRLRRRPVGNRRALSVRDRRHTGPRRRGGRRPRSRAQVPSSRRACPSAPCPRGSRRA